MMKLTSSARTTPPITRLSGRQSCGSPVEDAVETCEEEGDADEGADQRHLAFRLGASLASSTV